MKPPLEPALHKPPRMKPFQILCGLAILVPCLPASSSAAAPSEPVDEIKLRVLRVLSPRETYDGATVFAPDNVLLKRYTSESGKARFVESRDGFDPQAVAERVEFVRRLAADRFLSYLYDREPREIDASEVEEYYESHLDRYTRPPSVTWVQAELRDASDENTGAARRALYEWLASLDRGEEPSKTEAAGFSISMERDQVLGPGHPLRDALAEAAPGVVIEPFARRDGSGTAMLVVVESDPGEVIPFEDVKESVTRDFVRDRSREAMDDLRDAAEETYPIRFSERHRDYHESEKSMTQLEWGRIGSITIDDEFLEALQLVHPEFFFSPDPDVFRDNLHRFFVFPRLESDRLRKDDPQLLRRESETLKVVADIARDRYLATLWADVAARDLSVTHEEARAYFDSHAEEFVTGGRYSYLLAHLEDDGDETVRRAKQAMIGMVGQVHHDDTKNSGDGFTVVHVSEMDRLQGSELFDALSAASEGEVFGPLWLPGRSTPHLVLVTRIFPATRPDFESVRDVCIQRVKHAKLAELEAHPEGYAENP